MHGVARLGGSAVATDDGVDLDDAEADVEPEAMAELASRVSGGGRPLDLDDGPVQMEALPDVFWKDLDTVPWGVEGFHLGALDAEVEDEAPSNRLCPEQPVAVENVRLRTVRQPDPHDLGVRLLVVVRGGIEEQHFGAHAHDHPRRQPRPLSLLARPVRQRAYVDAARALGLPGWRIIFSEVLPNVLAPVVVLGSLDVAQAILLEASLGFFGLGDPNLVSWGGMLNNAQAYLREAWWMSVFPGLGIALAVVGFNLVGDGLNDAINPRLNE